MHLFSRTVINTSCTDTGDAEWFVSSVKSVSATISLNCCCCCCCVCVFSLHWYRTSDGLGSQGYWNTFCRHGRTGWSLYAQEATETQVPLWKKQQGTGLLLMMMMMMIWDASNNIAATSRSYIMSNIVHPTSASRLQNSLRSASSSDYTLPRLRTKFVELAFSQAGPAAWNGLPENIHANQDRKVFRKQLKTYFLP